ncbi:MAG: CvpA family protein, partial [Rhodobacteraceae bacterium]|nr:CvpA family protein [Paracoccaceae bacterium]
MSEFNLFDTVAVFIILFSAYFAYLRGIVREVMAILSWIASAIAAYLLAPQFVPVVKDLPILGEYLVGSCELSVIVAFTLVFAATLIVFSLATLVLTR